MVSIEDVCEDLKEDITEECMRFGEVRRVIVHQERQGEEENSDVIVKIFVEFTKSLYRCRRGKRANLKINYFF